MVGLGWAGLGWPGLGWLGQEVLRHVEGIPYMIYHDITDVVPPPPLPLLFAPLQTRSCASGFRIRSQGQGSGSTLRPPTSKIMRLEAMNDGQCRVRGSGLGFEGFRVEGFRVKPSFNLPTLFYLLQSRERHPTQPQDS